MATGDSNDSARSLAERSAIHSNLSLQELGPRSDLTYRKLEKVTVHEADIRQSLLTGSLLRECVWQKVNFQRSDLDGLRAEQCRFIECDFRICDMRSSHFSRCAFEGCVFDDTYIDDCEFRGCELKGCTFKGASQTGCRFYNCGLSACSLSPGTFLHNRLYSCSVSDMLLGDCTILHCIFRSCDMQRVTINTESIGGILGLTPEQVRAAKLVYLGKAQFVPTGSDLITLVLDEYRRRSWDIGELVLALNFGFASTMSAFDGYLSRSLPRFSQMGFAKGDEVQFLGDILEELASLERLPLITAMNVLKWCRGLKISFENAHESRGGDEALRSLASRTTFLVNGLVDRLEPVTLPLDSMKDDIPLTLRASFHKKPTVPLCEVLNSLSSASSLPIRRESSLVRAEEGSYVEIVSTTLFSAVALQVFLFLINGCVIQLTELKHRLKVLARKEGPKQYLDLALGPTQTASPMVLGLLQGLTTHAKSLAWLRDPSLSGYDATNIQELEILRGKEG